MVLTAQAVAQLRDWELGRWRGRSLDDLADTEPGAVGEWLSDPAAAPHGGEPLVAVLARAAEWLTGVPGDGHTVVVTHSALVRGIAVAVLGAPPESFWRIDVAPLTATTIRGGPGRWTLRSLGDTLRPRGTCRGGP